MKHLDENSNKLEHSHKKPQCGGGPSNLTQVTSLCFIPSKEIVFPFTQRSGPLTFLVTESSERILYQIRYQKEYGSQHRPILGLYTFRWDVGISKNSRPGTGEKRSTSKHKFG